MRTALFLKTVLITFLAATSVQAQTVQITSPATDTSVATCDDYATAVLNDPWDMNASTDINNYIPSVDFVNFSSASFSGGIFKANAATNDPHFQLLSPRICGAHAISGRWGEDFPIDSTRYQVLSFRMFTDTPGTYQILWHHGCDYHLDWVITDFQATKAGWHTYSLDLTSVGASDSAGPVIPWGSKPVTGLRLDPTGVEGARVEIDWVRLEPVGSSCTTTNVSYTTSVAGGTDPRLTMVLDDDADPFNGFVGQPLQAVDAANDTIGLSTAGIEAGSYQIHAFLSSDYATGVLGNPWDFDDRADYVSTRNVQNERISGGALLGTSTAAATVRMTFGPEGINADRYNKLSIRVTQSVQSNLAFIWGDGSAILTKAGNDPDDNDVYELDLSADGRWSGNQFKFEIRPAQDGGVDFSLDFVALTTDNFVSSLNEPTVETAAGSIVVNRPPQFKFLQPDKVGGTPFKGWNFDVAEDVLQPAHLDISEILTDHNISGRVGDFFHGRNVAGNRDPVNYLTHPTASPELGIDASRFKHLTWGMAMPDTPGRVDVTNGSVMRIIYKRTTDAPDVLFDGDDIVTIVDAFSSDNWFEYYANMDEYLIEGGINNWNGTIDALRIDSHEFDIQQDFYFDYVYLRADDEANETFALTVDLSDQEGDNVAAELFYRTSPGTSGGVSIGTVRTSDASRTLLWDTSALANGDYYLYAVISDGTSSTRRQADGIVRVDHGLSLAGAAPQLSVEAPAEGVQFDSFLQLKGFALDDIHLASVEVTIDGDHLTTIQPRLFHLGARNQNPDLPDSSNAGFDGLFDTTGLANGAHTITVTAFDTAGQQTSVTRSVTKSSGAQLPIIEDPAPAGESLPVSGVPGGEGAPEVQKVKLTKKGKLTFDVGQINAEGCTITLFSGAEDTGVLEDRLLSTTVTSQHLKKGIIRYTATKLKVKATSVPEFYLQATRECPGEDLAISAAKVVRVKGKKGAKTYEKALRKLKKRLKQRKKKKKKKR